MPAARPLRRDEVPRVWDIDRSEIIHTIYRLEAGALRLAPHYFDVRGWPPGEAELYTPLLLDCFDRGGWFMGIFEGETLAAAAVLESKFIGPRSDQLQLKFMHVGRPYRGQGLGRALFEMAKAEAVRRGAKGLYISATPSEHTVRFYRSLGCRLARRLDPELYALEPEDIHLEYDLEPPPMTDSPITTKAQLLPEIDRDWAALNAALDALTEEQMTAVRDAQGWAVKDHLVHLAAWERSMVFLFNGRPRHEGLGVPEAVYLQGDDDAINAVIQQNGRALAALEARDELRLTHLELMALLQPLTDDDLRKPYRHYLPNEPGEGDGPPIINLVYGNTAHHFREHLGWIQSLTQSSP